MVYVLLGIKYGNMRLLLIFTRLLIKRILTFVGIRFNVNIWAYLIIEYWTAINTFELCNLFYSLLYLETDNRFEGVTQGCIVPPMLFVEKQTVL